MSAFLLTAAGGDVPAEIAALGPWFHNLHLPDGTQTAPDHPFGDFPTFKWEQIRGYLPENLDGWTALDIGCNAGFYSIEVARRGAQVTAIDHDPHFLAQARWACERFGLSRRITFHDAPVYALGRWARRFDLVLFMGIFYHLRYPLLALDLVAEKAKQLLVFQTLTMPGEDVVEAPADLGYADRERVLEAGWPKLAFFEHAFAGDPTNWWAPNHAAVEAMLRSSGLRVVARPGHEIYLCEPAALSVPQARTWDAHELDAAAGRTPGELDPTLPPAEPVPARAEGCVSAPPPR